MLVASTFLSEDKALVAPFKGSHKSLVLSFFLLGSGIAVVWRASRRFCAEPLRPPLLPRVWSRLEIEDFSIPH